MTSPETTRQLGRALVRPGGATRRTLTPALALVMVLSGCGLTHPQNLNFRVDNRFEFVSPEARALVKQPLTVSWTMKDFTVAAKGSQSPSTDAGYFAIFVDRSPIKPGETMKAVAKGDRVCERSPDCPNKGYLEQHEVYETTGTSFTLPRIPNVTGNKETVQVHSITIILLDTGGHRIGESAWQLDVRMRKVGS